MKVHHENLSDVLRYIEKQSRLSLEEKEEEFQSYLRVLRRFKEITPETRLMEIGPGVGWFPLLCAKHGLYCKGVEISPQLVEYAKETAQRYGLPCHIEVGNIEESDVGFSEYDVVIARAVFEHIEHWQVALRRVYNALKPGGIFFFTSENKFSFKSGEYHMPFYGWLPNRWRYRLRVARQGPDIMKLGIDFNQFTYPGLRRAFRQVGFSRVYDRLEVADADHMKSSLKRAAVKTCRRWRPIREMILLFSSATIFICQK